MPTAAPTAPGVDDERHPLRSAPWAHGQIVWREAGAAAADRPALVLLHGIGSGSASWSAQLDALRDDFRVLAWDAPGYGGSSPLPNPKPLAIDYAEALAAWLAPLQIGDLVLVGHSLGALMAAAWAAEPRLQAPATLRSLVLVSPARGYASATAEVRAAKYRQRIEMLDELGIAGIAATRSSNLCSPNASPEVLEQVRRNMARATPGGYAQAAHLLAHDDLLTHLQRVDAPASVLCGQLDGVTPPGACEEVARAINAPFTLLRGVAHACYVEDPAQFNRALRTGMPALGAAHG